MRFGFGTDYFGRNVADASAGGVVLYICAVPFVKIGDRFVYVGVIHEKAPE